MGLLRKCRQNPTLPHPGSTQEVVAELVMPILLVDNLSRVEVLS